MIIKKIILHNIRSYLDSEIELPQGNVLLSGDIGSGKSTVLLAIEFALFGIQRGIMDGATLLRNGKKEGSVEMEFKVEKHNIKIKRNLKRSKDKVTQSGAVLILDGIKKELTPTELKSFVLDILNYPASLLTKKSLIYRYTVYTPQEEMKRIMLETSEVRLDTLRKVFDIDKYKLVINNSEIFLTKLKEKKKEKEGQLVDLPFKKQEIEKKEKVLLELNKKLESKAPLLLELQKEINNMKERIKEEQKNLEILNKKRIKIAETNLEIKERTNQIQELGKEEDLLSKIIKKSKLELRDIEDIKDIAEQKSENETLLENGRQNEKIFEREINTFTVKKEKFLEDSKKISQLKFCPVCKQKVTLEHRDKIIVEINEEIKKIDAEMQKKLPVFEELKKDIEKIEFRIKKINEEEKKLLAYKVKVENMKEKETRKLKIYELKNSLNERIIKLKKILESEESIVEKYKNLEEQHKKILEKIDDKRKQENELLMERAVMEQSLKDFKREVQDIGLEIKNKEKIAQNLSELGKIQEFLTKNFAVVVEIMEKQVMLRLNLEFNSLFKKWFNMLVDDPNLEARIDPEFSPLIQQAGYEINYEYLSGGEKTALALAYRLALNQVINSMLSKVNTRDLLILDEPTDGFSAEQLDKMRDVLNELKTEQLILVSHESKIESFVQHVIKFAKEGHVSNIIK